MTPQGELDFGSGERAQGYEQWLTGRRAAAKELAARLGLPLGHQVELWLVGGIRLKGLLRLREELLFVQEEQIRHLELAIDNTSFSTREIESCVRLD